MASTTLSLVDESRILADLMTVMDKTVCSLCSQKLSSETYIVCRWPDIDASMKNTAPKEHNGHTVCKDCGTDPLKYIGEGGACKVCLTSLGNRRSAFKYAGVGLRPAVKNMMANTILSSLIDAEKDLERAKEMEEEKRIADGNDRRAAAVEEVRAKKEKEMMELARLKEEAEMVKKKMEEEEEERRKKMEKEEEERRKKMEEEEEKRRRIIKEEEDERRKKMEEEEESLRKKMEEEEEEWRMGIENTESTLLKEVKARQKEVQDEAARIEEFKKEEAERKRLIDLQESMVKEKMEDLIQRESKMSPPKRKRKAQSAETVSKRVEKSQRTREEKKVKLQEYPRLVRKTEALNKQLLAIIEMASEKISFLGGSIEEFEKSVSLILDNEDEAEESDPEPVD